MIEGFANAENVDFFASQYEQATVPADFDGDGAVTSDDLVGFVVSYTEGT